MTVFLLLWLLSQKPVADQIEMRMARIHFHDGDYAEAERKLRALMPNLDGILQATALNDLGMVRAARGDLAEARELIERALAAAKAADARTGRGEMLGNLALICFRQGDLVSAANFYREAIPILEATLGPDHAHLGMALAEYSQVLRKSGNKPEARTNERRAKAIFAVSGLSGLHTVNLHSLK